MREEEHQNERIGKLRTTMSQDRLNSLARQLDYSDVIDEFANVKSRKRCFQR